MTLAIWIFGIACLFIGGIGLLFMQLTAPDEEEME